MLRAGANELSELIRRLGSRRQACVDAARARLASIGPRAVEELVQALEGGDDRIRGRVMPLLALIQDRRGRGPLIAMLLDRSSRLRETAARSLGRFPSSEAVNALVRALEKERSEKVKIAAVQALIEQYDAGQDQAICKVLELITDASLPTGLRLAALALLPRLRPSAWRGILERLQEDPCEDVRRAAARIEEPAAGCADPGRAVAALGSNDYAVWNAAVTALAGGGAAAIDPLIAEMQSRAHDPEFCKRAAMALKAMGPRRARAIANALDGVEEPLPLQMLVEVIGALGEAAQVYRLKDLIDRLARRTTDPGDANGLDPLERVRAKAHLELARIGSRVAILDLCEALGDAERRVEVELLTAVELIGSQDEIGLLLGVYGREDEFVQQRIGDAVRAILKRERIRRNDRMFRSLGRDQQRALQEILPPPAPRRVRRASQAASRSSRLPATRA